MTQTFITILLIFGSVGIGLFYLNPEWKEFKDLQNKIENINSISLELDELINEQDSLVTLINTISKEDLNRIEKTLPEGPHTAEFLVMLENLSIENKVVLQSINLASFVSKKAETTPSQPTPGSIVLAPKSEQLIKELPVDLVVIGTYQSFKDFLNALERNLRIIDVISLNFTSAGDTDLYTFTVRLKTYYQ